MPASIGTCWIRNGRKPIGHGARPSRSWGASTRCWSFCRGRRNRRTNAPPAGGKPARDHFGFPDVAGVSARRRLRVGGKFGAGGGGPEKENGGRGRGPWICQQV